VKYGGTTYVVVITPLTDVLVVVDVMVLPAELVVVMVTITPLTDVLVMVVELIGLVLDGEIVDVMVLPAELVVVMTPDAESRGPPGVEEARKALIFDSRAAI
jgi:hypothetical protein